MFDPQLTSGAANVVGANFASSSMALGSAVGIDYDLMAKAVERGVAAGQQAKGDTSQPTSGQGRVPSPGAKGKTATNVATEGHAKTPGTSLRGLVSRMSNETGMALNQAGRQRYPKVAQIEGKWFRGPKAGETLPVINNTFGPGTEIGAKEALLLASRGGALDAITGAIGGIGGEGIMGGLAAAGPVGVGAAAVIGAAGTGMEMANMIASQRQQNAFYQGILGGTNLSGLSQRAEGGMFRLSALGNLSGAQANALFQGTTALDMTGGQRSNAMSQAIKMYDQLGVSVQSSIQNITIAAQSGNKELNNLAASIDAVTTAAVTGGVNANVARQTFTTAYQAVTQNIQGSNAPAVAAGMSGALANMGQVMQGVDPSGFLSQNSMLTIASQNGLTEGQMFGELETGKANYGSLFSKGSGSILNNMGVPQSLATAIQSLGYNSAFSKGQQTTAQIQNVIAQMEQQPTGTGLMNSLQSMYQMYGENLTIPQAMTLAVGSLLKGGAGSFNPGAIEAAAKVNPKTTTFASTTQANELAGNAPWGLGIPVLSTLQNKAWDLLAGSNTVPVSGAASAAYKSALSEIGTQNGPLGIFGKSGPEKAATWYAQNYLDKGKQNALFQKMLGDENANSALFQVQTAKGPMTVGLQDLLQNYSGQAAAGTATFLTGPNRNTTISSTYAFQTPNNKQGVPVSPVGGDPKNVTKEQTSLNAQVAKDNKNQTLITVAPTQALLQWMQFNSNSPSVTVDSGTGSNTTLPQYPTTNAASGNYGT